MAGVYVHIPFCKQACHYCDFHFSTSTNHVDGMAKALLAEINLRRDFFGNEQLDTIYFGGGTPSLMPVEHLKEILGAIKAAFNVAPDAEISLEANPDDISAQSLDTMKALGINRLSMGIQSFDDEALRWMNRAHTSAEAKEAVRLARDAGFDNVTIDLIYGLPQLSPEKWDRTLQEALSLEIDHISAYCLTVERGTALGHRVAKGTEKEVDEEAAAMQFQAMLKTLESAGFEQYEISNFARNKKYSRHNTSYWTGEKYLGLGPSAHSYDGEGRSWNISSNPRYTKAIMDGTLPNEREILSPNDRYNEWVMTGLRTRWGIAPADALKRYGIDMEILFGENLQDFIERDLARMESGNFTLTRQGRLLADGIASELFITD